MCNFAPSNYCKNPPPPLHLPELTGLLQFFAPPSILQGWLQVSFASIFFCTILHIFTNNHCTIFIIYNHSSYVYII